MKTDNLVLRIFYGLGTFTAPAFICLLFKITLPEFIELLETIPPLFKQIIVLMYAFGAVTTATIMSLLSWALCIQKFRSKKHANKKK